MGFYGEADYGETYYGIEDEILVTVEKELKVGIITRIVKAPQPPVPIMDTLAYGLAQRFAWLQEGIQVFGLLNKIDYAVGVDLDNHFGNMYDLPRMTGESDDDYRDRLKIYLTILTNSGTAPSTKTVLDYLVGIPGTSEVNTFWPSRVVVTYSTAAALLKAKARKTLLESILPGTFAAGVDYELLLPIEEFYIKAAIKGPRTLDYNIAAAIQTDNETACAIDALIAYSTELAFTLGAYVQGDRNLPVKIKTALKGLREVTYLQTATIQGTPELPFSIEVAIRTDRTQNVITRAAIMGDSQLDYTQRAAIQRTFQHNVGILAYLMVMRSLEYTQRAAIQTERELSVSLRARIAKSYGG